MIKIKFESAGHPDCSRIVGAEMDKEYTAIGFIDEILKMHPKDYGYFTVGDMCYYYKEGSFYADSPFMQPKVMDKIVVGVKGVSSYYNTNYELILKDY